MVKTVGKYDLYGTLGEGAFGKVKYAVNTETNEAVAIKILDKDKIQTRNMGAQIKKEISIMKMIHHHHVVGVKDVFATSAKIFIVLEFVGGGELFDKIANEGKLPEDKARFYFRQLVEGLEHCHNNGVCHRDLKPENLLLDNEGNLKISDFGFSTLNIGDADGDSGERVELLHTTCGTPNYVAPEVLGKDGYDGKKADVWSIGVILYVLLAGYLPFDENTMAALFTKIKAAEYEFPEWFSLEARDLISKVLVPDPMTRAKLSDLKNHPWFKREDASPIVIHPNQLTDVKNRLSAETAQGGLSPQPTVPPHGSGEGHKEVEMPDKSQEHSPSRHHHHPKTNPPVAAAATVTAVSTDKETKESVQVPDRHGYTAVTTTEPKEKSEPVKPSDPTTTAVSPATSHSTAPSTVSSTVVAMTHSNDPPFQEVQITSATEIDRNPTGGPPVVSPSGGFCGCFGGSSRSKTQNSTSTTTSNTGTTTTTVSNKSYNRV